MDEEQTFVNVFEEVPLVMARLIVDIIVRQTRKIIMNKFNFRASYHGFRAKTSR